MKWRMGFRMWLIACFLASVSPLAAAVDTRSSYQLQKVPLVDLVRLVFSDVLGKSYILDPDFLKNEEVVTLHVRNLAPADVERVLRSLIEARGFAFVDRAGVVHVGKRIEIEADKRLLIYRPQFRSVSYLLDLVGVLFPRGAFTSQRQIANAGAGVLSALPPNGTTSPAHVQAAAIQKGRQMQLGDSVADSGTSAYSLLDKNEQDAIIFRGTEKETVELANLFDQLDKPAGELLVKAVVYEVRHESAEGNAVTLAASLLAGKFGIAFDGGATAGNAVKLKFNDFDAMWSALSGDKRFKLISSPTVRIKSGATARFVAGSDVPVLGNVSYTQTGQQIQAVEYKTSGVVFDLKPQVRQDSTDLTIFQQISSFVPTTSGVNQTPTLLKRELQTQVSAKAEEIIVLGGLDESQDTDQEQGLSFLPAFLRSSGTNKQRTEIMLMLHVQRLPG